MVTRKFWILFACAALVLGARAVCASEPEVWTAYEDPSAQTGTFNWPQWILGGWEYSFASAELKWTYGGTGYWEYQCKAKVTLTTDGALDVMTLYEDQDTGLQTGTGGAGYWYQYRAARQNVGGWPDVGVYSQRATTDARSYALEPDGSWDVGGAPYNAGTLTIN